MTTVIFLYVKPGETRMRTAIDLVLNPYNDFKDEVFRKAFQNWTDLESKRKNLVKK